MTYRELRDDINKLSDACLDSTVMLIPCEEGSILTATKTEILTEDWFYDVDEPDDCRPRSQWNDTYFDVPEGGSEIELALLHCKGDMLVYIDELQNVAAGTVNT